MNDSNCETAADFEDPCRFAHRTRHVVDVLKRQERDGEVDSSVCEWQIGGVGLEELELGAQLASRGYHFRGGIDSDHAVTHCSEVSTQPAFAASDVESDAARRRHDFEETIPMKLPIAVVTRLSGPANPVVGVLLPCLAQHCDKSARARS